MVNNSANATHYQPIASIRDPARSLQELNTVNDGIRLTLKENVQETLKFFKTFKTFD
jgi:hypothetical protein